MSEKLEVHEHARIFPLMEGEELAVLVEDIKKHGLLEPIVLVDKRILDGRNRYRACEEAGVKPRFKKYQGNGTLEYVISKNAKRRHLTPSQLGVIALDLEKEFAKQADSRKKAGSSTATADKGRAADLAGEALGISGDTVSRVKFVALKAPDLIPQIRSGKMSAREAERESAARMANNAARKWIERAEEKKRQENPREVKEYLDAIRAFRDCVSTAKRVAAYGKFSPEAKRFTKRKHDELRAKLAELDAEFDKP